MSMDHAENVGKRYMRINVEAGLSPTFEAYADPSFDAAAACRALTADMWAAVRRHFGEVRVIDERFGAVVFHEHVLGTPDEEVAANEAAWKPLRESAQAAERARQAEIDANPDRRSGYWHVDGIRHDARVRASSEREAINKAIEADLVGSWESPRAAFVGEQPDAM